jgi:hypothetical protein
MAARERGAPQGLVDQAVTVQRKAADSRFRQCEGDHLVRERFVATCTCLRSYCARHRDLRTRACCKRNVPAKPPWQERSERRGWTP